MKFKVVIKDPDMLHNPIRTAVIRDVDSMEIDQEEKNLLIEARIEKVHRFCEKWVEYGEYLTVEIDTLDETCVVVERS